jgi:hypothetical protein
MLTYQINQIAALIKVSILKATNWEPVRTDVGEHAGTDAVEAEAASIGTDNRTTPIAAVATHIENATNTVVAGARHRQL